MRPQTLVVVALALICGLAAALGVRSIWKQPVAPVETVPAVVATVDVGRGETIDETMIEILQVPKSEVPDALISISKLEDAVSRTAYIPMLKGEFVVEPKLFPKGSGAGLASLIQPGMRAFTIQTPSFSSTLAGLLLPGNRVDVLLTMDQSHGPEATGATTTTLLQNVELLAVHTMVDTPTANKTDPNEARSVTLLVTPKQASILDLGQNKGTLHLSLRNLKDEQTEPATLVTMEDLGLPKPSNPEPEPILVAAEPTPPPPPPEVEQFVLPSRTMRGTAVGYDLITIVQSDPSFAAKRPPAPASKLKQVTRAKPPGPPTISYRPE